MNQLRLLNIDNLVSEYTTLNDNDDDWMASLKQRLSSLSLPDLRLIVVWIEYNQNYGLCARYFNTTVYFIKKRLNKILNTLKWNQI